MDLNEPILVLTNVPDHATAQAVARNVLEQKLAACVNILPGVRSVYRWQGDIEEAEEITVLIKSTTARYPELQDAIKTIHPYDVPEIIAMSISAGLPAYLNWIATETKKDVDV
ncbi:divalent-cation tolerance protein CutA [Noviherbaspirillum saxi]|uniref:Divalent-cation tolerance protein CutA n=1 Tax=Noviherbaspirillum saxi TaxID=2320863 RepID=A0A3A3FZU6_9BURK|nr:divalent-cation tolerance protein CutA [Noviherbaspirillum saxi]RJF99721.1 divalent-cation tolerance protein CutA [Noviherbaspirillum saxi]